MEIKEKFYELPQEKQQRIINAALEVFAKNDYRHAITDDIATKAGISKGLLFYYFKNKETLYLCLFDYCKKLIGNHLSLDKIKGYTDFFELIEFGAKIKSDMMEKNPYLLDFCIQFYYSSTNESTQKMLQDQLNQSFDSYFANVDFTKFKDCIDPKALYQMLVWMTDGYLNEKRRSHQLITSEEIITNFRNWVTLFKQMAYKEEYL